MTYCNALWSNGTRGPVVSSLRSYFCAQPHSNQKPQLTPARLRYLRRAYKAAIRGDFETGTVRAGAEPAPIVATATHITEPCVSCHRRFTRPIGAQPYCDRPKCRKLAEDAEELVEATKTALHE